jgi:hypothetical protein
MRLRVQRRFSAPPATCAFGHHCRRPHHLSSIERALRLAARVQSSFARAPVLWRTSLLAESRPLPSAPGPQPRTAANTIRDPKRSALLGLHRREILQSDSSRCGLPSRNIAAERPRSWSLSSNRKLSATVSLLPKAYEIVEKGPKMSSFLGQTVQANLQGSECQTQ